MPDSNEMESALREMLACHSGYPLCRCRGCIKARRALGITLHSMLISDDEYARKSRQRMERQNAEYRKRKL